MKINLFLATFLLSFTLSGCGQPGPLYLPTDKPPIYVAPEENTQSDEEVSKPKTENQPETEKASPQPLPTEKSKSTTDQ